VNPMQCVILAGGLGTRMSRFTSTMPKPLIPVAGEPFVRHQLRLLAASGVSDVVISTGYLGHMIEAEVADHSPPGVEVRCVSDGADLLGTAGAIRRLVDRGELDELFLVVYGDSYLRISYSDVWSAFQPSRYHALMTVLRNIDGLDASNAVFRDGEVVLYRKGVDDPGALDMHYVDYGLSVWHRDELLRLVPTGVPFDMATVFEGLSSASLLQGYEVEERFFEVGSPRGLSDLEQLLGLGTP
jgi:NDP-sugar pyrophosphorylase family protein